MIQKINLIIFDKLHSHCGKKNLQLRKIYNNNRKTHMEVDNKVHPS